MRLGSRLRWVPLAAAASSLLLATGALAQNDTSNPGATSGGTPGQEQKGPTAAERQPGGPVAPGAPTPGAPTPGSTPASDSSSSETEDTQCPQVMPDTSTVVETVLMACSLVGDWFISPVVLWGVW